MRRLFLTLLIPFVTASLAQAEVVRIAGAGGNETFSMPSGNVECVFTPRGGSETYSSQDGTAELSCDRRDPTYRRVWMTERSEVAVEKDVGDASCCSVDNVLAYGKEWRGGPFHCLSLQAGLRCTRTDGRGFRINRAGINLF